VASKFTTAFSEMIFCNGFVHCDPHPVSKSQNAMMLIYFFVEHGRFQIIFLTTQSLNISGCVSGKCSGARIGRQTQKGSGDCIARSWALPTHS
jgi:hypothetical protein